MRFIEIDLIKGFAVIAMVIFHIYYMNVFVAKINYNIDTGILHFLSRFAHTTFIIFMGINTYLNYQSCKNKTKKYFYLKTIKRSFMFLLISLLVSFTSFLGFGKKMFVKFGIFHYMSIASIITSLFVDKPKIASLMIILINLIKNTNLLNNIDKYTAFILGSSIKFNSLDYFPLLRWTPFSLLGIIIGNVLYKNNKRNFDIKNLDSIIDNNYILKYISILGSKTILIYLTHFPLIYSLLK